MLFLILVAEIGSAVLLGVYKSSINKCLECSMQHQVQYSYNKTDLPHIKSDNATDLLTLAWDRMQEGVSAAVSSYMTVCMCFILWHVKETTALQYHLQKTLHSPRSLYSFDCSCNVAARRVHKTTT